MIRSWALMAIMCGSLALGCAGASRAMTSTSWAPDAEPPIDDAMRARSQPWWSGFDDETMSELIESARLRSASAGPAKSLDAIPVEVGVAAAYVSLRVHMLGLTYLENARSAITRQLQLMIASKPQHDDFIRELNQRKVRTDDLIKKINAQRDIHLAFLSAQCGMSQEELNAVIDSTREDRTRTLPHFQSPVPHALPAALLLNRNDVNLAAALYGIDPAERLSGAIEAMDESTGSTESEELEATHPDYPLYAAVVAQARSEVSEALHHLQAQSDIADTAYTRVQSAKSGFQASKERRDRGQMSEVRLMEDFQELLHELQALSVANGDLAVAWIALIGRLGDGTSIDGSSTSTSTSARVRVLPQVSQRRRDP